MQRPGRAGFINHAVYICAGEGLTWVDTAEIGFRPRFIFGYDDPHPISVNR